MRARMSALALVVCIAVLLLTLGVPTAAARGTSGPAIAGGAGHTIVVRPNGIDDTANIQAALNQCTTPGPPCTVQLVKGTYYISQVAVYGFQGSFIGAGQGITIVQGLPNLPPPNSAYDTATVPFWAGLPGPSNPWPVLFTFVGGTFGISGMTIRDTSPNPVQGWVFFGLTYTGLWAMIEITGEAGQPLAATVHDLTLIGGAGDIGGFNNGEMVAVQGILLPSGWTSAYGDQIPLSGTFSVTKTTFYNASSAVLVENLLNAAGVACSNTVTNTLVATPVPFSVTSTPFAFVDLSNSQLRICGNYVTNVPWGVAVIGYQSANKADLLPSTVYVTGNVFRDLNFAGEGVFLWDEGATSTLSAVISGNVMQTDLSCGCYGGPGDDSTIFTISLVSVTVEYNTLISGAGIFAFFDPAVVIGNAVLGNIVGVGLYSVPSASVVGNVITNSATYGIDVVAGSSGSTIAYNYVKNSGLYDLYWDQTGTGDHWYGNIYATSSPAPLP